VLIAATMSAPGAAVRPNHAARRRFRINIQTAIAAATGATFGRIRIAMAAASPANTALASVVPNAP